MSRRYYLDDSVSSSCPSYVPGFHSAEDIDNLVFSQGYIPISRDFEWNYAPTGLTQTFGTGTCWEGEYLSGRDKKYVIVEPIDFGGGLAVNWGRGDSVRFTGTIDGNLLPITNGDTTDTAFQNLIGWTQGATAIRLRVGNFNFSEGTFATGGVFGDIRNTTITDCRAFDCTAIYSGPQATPSYSVFIGIDKGGNLIEDCMVQNSRLENRTTTDFFDSNDFGFGIFCGNGIGSTYRRNGVDAACTLLSLGDCTGAFIGKTRSGLYEDCWTSAQSTGVYAVPNEAPFLGDLNGPFVAVCSGGTFRRCYANGSITTGRFGMGMFVGICFWQDSDCLFEECWTAGSITDVAFASGGFAGYVRRLNAFTVTFNDCYSWTDIESAASLQSTTIGGFIGDVRGGDWTLNRCYSKGAVVVGAGGTDGTIGGFGGRLLNFVGSVNACYWDTVTSGQASSAIGIGQTTAQLQNPIAPVGIYSTWSSPPWNFGTPSEYPILI